MDSKTRIITVATFTFLGIYSITCGAIYPKYQELKTPKTSFLLIEEKQVGIKKELQLQLKEITTEINIPLSVKIADYLNEEVSSEILAELKLDTSEVNVQQPGEYKYKVYYKKQVFEGNVIVKEKEIEQQQNTLPPITPKTITIYLNGQVPSDISAFVVENLTPEMRANMVFTRPAINTGVVGSYTYTIQYNGAYYQGSIYVIEDPTRVETAKKYNCQTVDGKYYDDKGNEVTEENYKAACQKENSTEETE